MYHSLLCVTVLFCSFFSFVVQPQTATPEGDAAKVEVVNVAPAVDGDGAGAAADTATEEVMDTGHSSDEDSLPPTPIETCPLEDEEVTATTEAAQEEGSGGGAETGADGGEGGGSAAETAAETEAAAEVEEVASPTDANDPAVCGV